MSGKSKSTAGFNHPNDNADIGVPRPHADLGQAESEPFQSTWSISKRFWVSLAIIVHLAAVMIAPLGAVDPRSQVAIELGRVARPYSEALFLNHGYRFFAPEPGPGHIVKYEIIDRAGNRRKGQFPDRSSHQPRLLYHRWFMLSETIFSQLSLTLDPQALAKWDSDIQQQIGNLEQQGQLLRANEVRQQYQRELKNHDQVAALLKQLCRSVGKVLLKQQDASEIKMTLVTRVLPSPYDILDGAKLDDERFTPQELKFPLGTYVSDDFGMPLEGQPPGKREPEAIDLPGESREKSSDQASDSAAAMAEQGNDRP